MQGDTGVAVAVGIEVLVAVGAIVFVGVKVAVGGGSVAVGVNVGFCVGLRGVAVAVAVELAAAIDVAVRVEVACGVGFGAEKTLVTGIDNETTRIANTNIGVIRRFIDEPTFNNDYSFFPYLINSLQSAESQRVFIRWYKEIFVNFLDKE